MAKRWRSGTLHLESPVSKRGRSDTLHPDTPVPATTPPQFRWPAGVLRALRPFRRLRDKQSDPSEARVKRPRLAPAQVMSTALEKGCDWSLGFDGRGPVFDEINKDWRHSIFLTGRAARKEAYFASASPENQRLLLGAHLHHLGKYSVPVSARRSLQIHMHRMTSEGKTGFLHVARVKKHSDCWFLRKDESYKRPPSCLGLALCGFQGLSTTLFCPRNSIGHA